MTKTFSSNLYDIACRVRPAKNFLGVLGRTTRRLGIRNEENLVQRAGEKLHHRKSCLDGAQPDANFSR